MNAKYIDEKWLTDVLKTSLKNGIDFTRSVAPLEKKYCNSFVYTLLWITNKINHKTHKLSPGYSMLLGLQFLCSDYSFFENKYRA